MRRTYRPDLKMSRFVQQQCRAWRFAFLSTPAMLAIALPFAAIVNPHSAQAQVVVDPVNVAYPQPNNTLKGASKILFSGIPDGGHVGIYIDLTDSNRATSFRTATSLGSYTLDTSSLSDGPHTLTLISFSSTGRQVALRTVPFVVSNAGSAGVSEDSVRLVNWTRNDVLNPKVQRYRVFAVSDATISGGAGGSRGSGGGESSGAGGAGGAGASIPAPLDHQVDIFIRRVVRDVGMINNSANIRLVVQEAFDRKREDAQQGASGGRRGSAKAVVGKAAWGEWIKSPESSQAYTKMITQNGREINATRKAATLPLGDILPEFPNYRVQPGATWNGDILVVGELTQRLPLRLKDVPMSFSGFDNIETPAGVERRAAKIEITNFSLPGDVAMRIARALQTEAGTGQGGGRTSGAGAGARGGGASEPPAIAVARADMNRVLWFDIASNQLLRSEDTVNAYYEEELPVRETSSSSSSSRIPFGVFPGSDANPSFSGAPVTPALPKSVTYNLSVVKFLDDRLPNPTNTWNGGLFTAHSRDSVRDPSIAKANGSLVNNR